MYQSMVDAFCIVAVMLKTPSNIASMHSGTEEACSFVNLAQVRLCALGADAEVLKEKGFPVHVHPEEVTEKTLNKCTPLYLFI